MALISDCCGADAQGYEDYGICPDCKEHCEFIDDEELDETQLVNNNTIK